MKKDGRNLVWYEFFFDVQDGKSNCTSPRLFFYCMRISINFLANQYIPLKIVNGTRAIAIRVVLNSKVEPNLYILE